MSQLTKKLSKKQSLSSKDQYEFDVNTNNYLSNRQMSDENRYILERKSQEQTIGNFLEKPTVLLKRQLVQ